MLLTNEHSLKYSQNYRYAFFFETLTKASIEVLRFESLSVCVGNNNGEEHSDSVVEC